MRRHECGLHPALLSPGIETQDTNTEQHEDAFISPAQTPQGSPSKNKMPPGAFDLPDVFSNAMKLLPTMNSTNKVGKQQPTSPSKPNLQSQEGAYSDNDPFSRSTMGPPGSPTRTSNKENASPAKPTLQKDASYISSAAASRQDPYRAADSQRPASPTRQRVAPTPTQEDMEKLAKPAVKRLANVTQLCKHTVLFKAMMRRTD